MHYPHLFENGETILQMWRWVLSSSVWRWCKWHLHLCNPNVEMGIILICLKVVELASTSMYCKSWSRYYPHLYENGWTGNNISVMQKLKSVLSSNWHGYYRHLFEWGGIGINMSVMEKLKWVSSSCVWRWWYSINMSVMENWHVYYTQR